MRFEGSGSKRCLDAGSSWSVRLKLRFLVLGAADNILILRAADRLNTMPKTMMSEQTKSKHIEQRASFLLSLRRSRSRRTTCRLTSTFELDL